MTREETTFTVKISADNPDSAPLRQTPGGKGRWGRYRFIYDSELQECDYWVVCENIGPPETAACPKSHTVLLTLEPPLVESYPNRFLRQFGSVITCHQDIRHPRKSITLQGLPWFIRRGYDQLNQSEPLVKSRLISVISSSKQMTGPHRRRYEFALRLKQHFGDEIDLFGRGIRDFEDKWDVLAPYKYSLALENSAYPHYISEKLTDCYLAETFPLYHGAPNTDGYFPRESFEPIDIGDFDATVRTIRRIIDDEAHYERHREAVLEAKRLCLEKHNMFAVLAAHLDALQLPPGRGETTLRRRQDFDHKVRRVFLKLKKKAVKRDR